MFRKSVPAILAIATLALPLGLPAFIQSAAAEAVRVRGAVVDADSNALTVKTREGETVTIDLAKGWMLSSVAQAAVGDIKPGDYVGIASLPTKNGGDGALEVLIFPAALKGTGEGSFGWDLKPDSTMTNATVADAVKGVDGRTVTVTYHGKEKKIAVPDGTPVVTLAPATQADLKPGAAVFVSGDKDAGGAIAAQQVVVGANGVVPPM
ncbi:hypothetical protein [Aurantimonas sp. HBX-1]|uniref:hypothetical protein n=1 Tax=Aurantimonas sp. HBX-1 TaxID=2906072 RepID=UPI001F1FCD41|nr:hypothetical protein [Aurantimonas sp. HBX-1]UIJ70370.1 hypothetical protein LXB15_11340 [Aurantimonas sp. HBX-1]